MLAYLRTTVKTGLGQILNHARAPRLLHRGRVLILAYHRVLPSESLPQHAVEPGMYVTDKTFCQHLKLLKAHYDILSMQEWLTSWSDGGLHPRGRYCLITFDDGWRDNYDVAFPILRHFGVGATIFLVTSFVDTQEWFWTEKATFLLLRGDLARLIPSPVVQLAPTSSPWATLRSVRLTSLSGRNQIRRAEDVARIIARLKEHPHDRLTAFCNELSGELGLHLPSDRISLTWDEIREMSARGIAFGSHSHTHPIFTRIPPHIASSQLDESRRILVSRRLNFTPVFCYPNGEFSAQTQALVRQAGYRAAVTTQDGLEPLAPVDRFAIRRICVHEDATNTDPLLALRLVAASGAIRTSSVAS